MCILLFLKIKLLGFIKHIENRVRIKNQLRQLVNCKSKTCFRMNLKQTQRE